MKIKGRKYAEILGIPIDSSPQEELLDKIAVYLKEGRGFTVVTPNPEIILASLKNESLKNVLKNADISIPDGVGTAWAARTLAGKNLKVIKGRVFMEELLYLANSLKVRVFFFGSTDSTIKKALEKCRREFPNLLVDGTAGPRFTQEAEPVTQKDRKILQENFKTISTFKPNLLFIALGAPKQELFVSKYLNEYQKMGVMTVGGSLDYFAGTKPKPPNALGQKFEWVWRLMKERGHIKRVFQALVVFPLTVVKQKIKSQ